MAPAPATDQQSAAQGIRDSVAGLKPKDLIGIPWRVAFALQADGWYLRQDIIWAKPNPMPESVTDRCTKAHEYVFLLSKQPRYLFDAEAIAEPSADPASARQRRNRHMLDRHSKRISSRNSTGPSGYGIEMPMAPATSAASGRSPRSPYSEAHFATFPPELTEPCIKAGCPKGGTVLDPFAGAGTVGLVADRLQRDALLIELNPAYSDLGQARIVGDAPLFSEFFRDSKKMAQKPPKPPQG